MPTVRRIGPLVTTGVDLSDHAHYRMAARAFRGGSNREIVQANIIGGYPFLSRFQTNFKPWDWEVRCLSASGYQARLNDFAAIETQLQAAIDYSLGRLSTPIYFWEQYGDQTTVRSYLIISGWIDEETRDPGGAVTAAGIVAHLHLETRPAGA